MMAFNLGEFIKLEPRNKTTNGIKSSLDRAIPHFGAPLVLLALMVSGLLFTTARASTIQDPQPEPSTTRFGQSVAVIGDITGDGVPDLVVGGPFHDSEFALSMVGRRRMWEELSSSTAQLSGR